MRSTLRSASLATGVENARFMAERGVACRILDRAGVVEVEPALVSDAGRARGTIHVTPFDDRFDPADRVRQSAATRSPWGDQAAARNHLGLRSVPGNCKRRSQHILPWGSFPKLSLAWHS